MTDDFFSQPAYFSNSPGCDDTSDTDYSEEEESYTFSSTYTASPTFSATVSPPLSPARNSSLVTPIEGPYTPSPTNPPTRRKKTTPRKRNQRLLQKQIIINLFFLTLTQ